VTQPNAAQLTEIVGLVEQQHVRPVVSKTFRLEEAAAAHQCLEKEHPRGKVVLTV
jgi:NADPH:quinone reductase-like Zn-dependent oxidoreductase